MTHKRVIAAILFTLAVPVLISVWVVRGVIRSQGDDQTLREKAKKQGVFRELQQPKSTTVYADLADLVNNSAAVIIGTVQKNTPVLSTDGKSLSLDYAITVEYVYKGRIKRGTTIIVSLPGGRMKFEDGSIAEIMTPWFKKMQNGKTYALFLQPEGGSSRFITTGEAQGVIEIPTTPEDRTVKTHSGLPNQTIRKYNGQDVKVFFRELRQVTGKPL
ncbi:MAG TPA: hypothetical protein VGJ37_05515 [Pyrinomonadaceae bacterium]|jgi:hypothetical protein